MAQINLLDKDTIDKIAAGEVVERPASVVKELLENAVDAGATAVTVEIKEGGISFLRVTDNGCGIEREQVPRAFLRHATSKIHTAEDLSAIRSLGFRGEALSSIAAVARLELITKTEGELTGIRYRIEGGEEVEAEEVGAPNGTTLLVRNLFFNVPVRKKFLKQPQTEGGYISDLMEHMALANPGVSFRYVNNGQTRFHTSGNGNLQEIIYRIYGRDIASALIPVDVSENGIRMEGFLGKPEINRANRNFEVYFVNGRFIKSGIIGKALEEGYRKYVMQHKFPFAVLHFSVDAGDIDVNVHPTKMEVRFTNQAKLYDFIARHVESALRKKELIPEVSLETPEEKRLEASKKIPVPTAPEPFEINRKAREAGNGTVAEETAPYTHTETNKEPAANDTKSGDGEESFFVDRRFLPKKEEPSRMPEKMQDVLQNAMPPKILGMGKSPSGYANGANHANVLKSSEHIFVEKPEQLDLFGEKMLTKEAVSEYRILGQVFDTYWLVAFHDKLFIIDQHAAHEKVKYEHFMKHLGKNSVESQMVNPPIIVTLTGHEETVLKESMEIFSSMGFEIESFGGNEYALRSVPSELYGCTESGLFTELLDELAQGTLNGAPSVIRQKIASMACKAAVKGNTSFDRAGIEALIEQLLALDDPYHCPHGRPTIISMSKYEIEKKFKRIV